MNWVYSTLVEYSDTSENSKDYCLKYYIVYNLTTLVSTYTAYMWI